MGEETKGPTPPAEAHVFEYDVVPVVMTRGAGGSLLVTRDRQSAHPGLKTTVRDTVGAGDSFTAAMQFRSEAEYIVSARTARRD